MSLSGILIIDKPEGMTSHDVVNRLRLRFRHTKIGHMGTLDPMATGVLPICLGKATRIGQFIDGAPKEYRGEIRFGFSTTTYDREGEITGEARPFEASLEDVKDRILQFTGEIDQIPPSFSAKKIGGVPSYKFARRGRPIATPAVRVTVERFEITSFAPPVAGFEVTCSPGTYIRSLAHDLGNSFGCGAHLLSLRRTRSGMFSDKDAVAFDAAAEPDILPLEQLLGHWLPVEISDAQQPRIAHGNPVPGPEGPRQYARILNKKGEFLAVGILENGWVRPRVVLTSNTLGSTSS
jgi:tRNA pseudouridine55 synthase